MGKIGKAKAGTGMLSGAMIAFMVALQPGRAAAADASWMAGQYGVSIHFYEWFYPAYTYGQAVESFDVVKYADQVKATGAKWVMFGLQQNFRNLPAPNLKYEELTLRSRAEYSSADGRDLVGELADALNAKGIKLILYWMAGGYFGKDPQAREIASRIGWDTVAAKATPAFTANTSAMLEEYSKRYGAKVSGWWVDACNGFFGFTDPANDFTPMVKAMRAGNPNANIALNQGVETFTKIHPGVDYAAGEFRDFQPLPPASGTGLINGIQWSMVSFLAPKDPGQDGGLSGWGLPGVRHADSLAALIGYTQKVLERKGAVTFDSYADLDGTIDPAQFHELVSIRAAIRKDTAVSAVALAPGARGRLEKGTPKADRLPKRKGAARILFPAEAGLRDGLGRGESGRAE